MTTKAQPLTFGGCPSCGSKTCVARQCTNGESFDTDGLLPFTAQPAQQPNTAYAALPVLGALVSELRKHRFCGDCYPENGWHGVNNALAQYAAWKRASHGQAPAGWTDADADAARLALELECLLMDTKDAAVVSKWWASANDALEMHRTRLKDMRHPATPQADSVTAPAAGAVVGPSEAPEGWRNQFAEAVYADLEAADNQDVPLEEYPTRILKALDSIVGPRHPTVIHWRNDAIQACIAIAYRYCRDPESFQYLKQDLQALIFAAPTTQAAPAPSVLEDAARESEYRRGYRHGYEQRDAEVRGALA